MTNKIVATLYPPETADGRYPIYVQMPEISKELRGIFGPMYWPSWN